MFSIFNSNSSTGKTYGALKGAVDATVERRKVINNNLTNINTKNYKRFDVVLNENLSKNDINLKTTSVKHIHNEDTDKGFKVVKDESSSMRKDGNNVDLDVETTNLSSNAILFNALVTQINNDFAMKSNVVKGGR